MPGYLADASSWANVMPPGGLDFLHPERAVRAGARQYHADRRGLPILGQRLEEQVDRQMRAALAARGASCRTPWAIVIVVFRG